MGAEAVAMTMTVEEVVAAIALAVTMNHGAVLEEAVVLMTEEEAVLTIEEEVAGQAMEVVAVAMMTAMVVEALTGWRTGEEEEIMMTRPKSDPGTLIKPCGILHMKYNCDV